MTAASDSSRRGNCGLGVLLWTLTLALSVSAVGPAFSEPSAHDTTSSYRRPLPFAAGWALERGIDLPSPFGAGVFIVTMDRDIEITDVRVTLPGNESVSVSNVASFAVRNHTRLAALKLDAWILPLLNLYVLAGHTWTDSRLDATMTLDRIFQPPVVLEVTEDSEIKGPLLGAGSTAVAGHGPWFILVDANYNYTSLPALDGGIAAWFLSARTGWSGPAGKGTWRAWLGTAYLTTDRTLTLHEESPALGSVVIEIDQRPLHPLTYQAGGSVGLGKRWEALLEAGSNFDDAFVGVLSVSFRF